MRKTIHLFVLLILIVHNIARAQQDPNYTTYMFNKLVFNPACAGSNDHLALNLVHRRQWMGLDGAPATFAFSAHTPMRNEHVGLGVSLLKEKIGPTGNFDLNIAYVYRIPVGTKYKLAIGIQAGMANWYADFFDVVVEHGSDPVYQNRYSRWLPNFGAGLYLYGKNFFAGISAPKLVEHDLRAAKDENLPINAKLYRHYYATLGGAIPLGEGRVVMRPSLLLRSSALFSRYYDDDGLRSIGSPTAVDLSCAFFFQETIWLGLSHRSALQLGKSSGDSFDVLVAWYLRNGLRMGMTYDIVTNKLSAISDGSIEIMVGYEFDIKVDRVASPRFF